MRSLIFITCLLCALCLLNAAFAIDVGKRVSIFKNAKSTDKKYNKFSLLKKNRKISAAENIIQDAPLTAYSGYQNHTSVYKPNNTDYPAKYSPFQINTAQKLYVILSSIFVTCLLTADIIGVKLFDIPLPFRIFGIKSIEHSSGMLTFPITFLLGDIINEYYGAAAAKFTTYVGLWMAVLVFVFINIAQSLPYLAKPYNITPQAFDSIFGSAKIINMASIVAYLIGSLSDIWLFGVIKRLTGGKFLWLRATGSTIISQFIDSFIITYLAFVVGKNLTHQPSASLSEVYQIAMTGYGLKFLLSLAMTPFIYALKYILTNGFGLVPVPVETIEDRVNNSPSRRGV
jgi:uncharacterized integral membrane protein (TIGR00697 family)